MISNTIYKTAIKHFQLQSKKYISLSTSRFGVCKAEFYTSQHEDLMKTVTRIVEKDINPHIDKWEADFIYPAKEVFKKLGDAGLLGITRSTDYGGLGLDYTYTVAFLEALAQSCKCSGVPMSIMVHTDCSTPALANFGSDELKRQFLAPSIAGDVVSAIGVSEPGAGSDVANIRTRAERRGDDLVINGEKMWITNGCQADWICLLANTSKGPSHKNKSLICVPMDTPGVKVLSSIKKIGNHSSDTGHIAFDDVRVPAKNIVGEEGMGFIYQMLQFQEERLAGAILCVSGMDMVIQETINYCRQRQIFGGPILDNQVVHFTLAELQTEVECLRALIYQAAASMVKGENVTLLASMAKLKAGKLSRQVADNCLQYWGGMGYSAETLVSRFYRDSRLISIGGGADEVMLSIICKLLGTLPKQKKF